MKPIRKIPEELLARLQGVIGSSFRSSKTPLHEGSFEHDAEYMERIVELIEIHARYFDSEVRGVENFPESGPALLVGNHSGPNSDPDTPAVMAAWYRKNGFDKPVVILSFDAVFGIPKVRDFFWRIGMRPASNRNAEAALDAGSAVLVYPGGGYEMSRPWSERNQIELAGRKGFIKLALRKGVPVIPVVGHGGHETSIVITRGQSIAKALGLDRFRFDTMPVVFALPWGFVLGPVPALIPLPTKVTVQICPPMSWSHLGPENAEDPEVLERCYREVVDVMQSALDDLAKEHPYPILTRLINLMKRD